MTLTTPPPTKTEVLPLPGGLRTAGKSNVKRSLSFHGRISLPLTLYALFTLLPFYWILLFAFRDPASTSWLPFPITFDNFTTVWKDVGFEFFFWNSVIVGVLTTAATLLLALPAGYAMARYKFKGSKGFMLVLLCTQFIPGAMMLIPLFQIFNAMGLINNLFGLAVADTVFHLPLAIIFMSTFISKIPVELEEAAMIDGCGRLKAFRLSVLPLLGPAVIAVGSFSFIGAWNNFLFGLMFISDQKLFTLPVGLSYTMGEYGVNFGVLAAGGIVAAVPVIIIFAIIQKFLVQGLGSGAVKG
ncbi:carbohydrate ABC transporter permease [Leucobacter coleopterorum]|uniref:Carbohydrate ABC transporter permease n=1 Tax=Leucobacter coleopterorum TaxID=2714933 RepID=A0ABX6JTL3_9MICO|nr:carbohydrate ABC transporter permease [Leucobacter coleopterorum]QIM17612.1 carbohydrate ABC transporter permease [Leucobacter coleopterorum]